MIARPLFAWLLLASACLAQAPSAVVTPRTRPVPSGGDFTLDATGSVSAFPLKWESFPKLLIRDVDQPPKQRFATFVEPPDGTYTIVVTALGLSEDGKAPLSSAMITQVVVGAQPPPQPPPDDGGEVKPKPKPPAPPAPVVAGKLYATFIYSLSDPSLGGIKDADLETALKALDCDWKSFDDAARSVDKSGNLLPTPYVDTRGLRPAVNAAGGLPLLLIQTADGKIVASLKSPASADAIIAQVKALRGGAR